MNLPGRTWLAEKLPEQHILRRGVRFLESVQKKCKKSFHQAKKHHLFLRRNLSLGVYGKGYLRDFYAASREAEIQPFLMWGTLLGCVREGELLRHDRDIDLGIVAADFAKKDALVAAMRRRGYEVTSDKGYKFRFARPNHDLRLDVDVFYNWQGMMVCASGHSDGTLLGESFSADAFDRLREITFLGDLKVLIPDAPESVLETIYGDWRTPVHAYASHLDPLNRLSVPLADPLAFLTAIQPASGPAAR
jgi:hypothetical protein